MVLVITEGVQCQSIALNGVKYEATATTVYRRSPQ